MNSYRRCRAAFTVVFLALAACSTLPGDRADTRAAYDAAIGDAAVASPRKAVALQPLPAGETVKVVSWVSAKRLPVCGDDAPPCAVAVDAGALWVTLDGEVQALCRSWRLSGEALRRRLEQLLGLPPDPAAPYRKVAFVEYRVARGKLARPCLGVDDGDDGDDKAPPRCTPGAQPATPGELRDFVGRQMAASYVVDDAQRPGYPYTRLGYTYDWAPDARRDHYGASEFVVWPASTIEAIVVTPTDDYCRAP